MTARYRRRDDIRVAALDTDGVVLHLGSRRYFTVSETALALLQELSAPRTVEELVTFLRSRYDVTPDHATTSVREFLKRCQLADMVMLEDSS